MRLSGKSPLSIVACRAGRLVVPGLLVLGSMLWLGGTVLAQDPLSPASDQERLHETEQWRQIQAHLPDPATATPQVLEQQGDILRARRFPEDAREYYNDALARGGNAPALLNKLGLTELEMKHNELARAYFQRAVKIDRKDGEAWNNLGAVAFVDGEAEGAVRDYKRAIKLQKRQAVYHANLATAYFETRDFRGGRRELTAALKLDPKVFERQDGFGGVAAHVLSSQERARFSFEMAKLYAQSGLEEQMLHCLSVASEAGMDVQREMLRDPVLAKYELDPRVVVLVHNADMLRASHAEASARPILPKQM